ncbi:acylneuraminate cytidylyltransferase family protein [Candidatus Parcubacteria bacterium]|nr:acylneuraminate cytidylyltransferase family protein [Candidatus Parcubacteria bacterium]
MIDNKKFVVIIPARGGSKRFPGKNIYPLNRKPLISYPIEAAKKSKYVDRIIVSTDDNEIAQVAKQYGAEIPFMRPGELSTDTNPVINAMIYTVKELEERENYHVDYTILLQPASPLIETEQVDKAIEIAIEKQADSVVAVAQVNTLNHPYNIREIIEDGTIKFWQEELHYQDLGKPKPKFYHAGVMWLSSFKTLIQEKKLEGKKNYPLILNAIYFLDIDYKEDLELVEAWMQYNERKQD